MPLFRGVQEALAQRVRDEAERLDAEGTDSSRVRAFAEHVARRPHDDQDLVVLSHATPVNIPHDFPSAESIALIRALASEEPPEGFRGVLAQIATIESSRRMDEERREG